MPVFPVPSAPRLQGSRHRLTADRFWIMLIRSASDEGVRVKTQCLLIAVLVGALAISSATASTTTVSKSTVSCGGALSWKRAASLEGSVHTFAGRVAGAKFAASSSGSPTFLDVGHPYPNPNRLSLVIWIENRAAFGRPESKYRGKKICVRGRVSDYRGSPEIVLRRPAQIKVAP